MTATVVWTEIPVTDIKASADFYASVFGWQMTIDENGPNPMAMFNNSMTGTGGHLYPGLPSKGSGSTIHLNVPGTLEDAIDRCKAAGGEVHGPVIEIPPGRFSYATDLDGNSIGLFETKAA